MINKQKVSKPLVLIILDGWGVAPPSKGNAIEAAEKPFFDSLLGEYPHTLLQASGIKVGLPEGEAGNSEVGHLNLGAGRIVVQDLTRINESIENGSFFGNKNLQEAFLHTLKQKSRLHLLGLIGTGTVHSSLNHLFALLSAAKSFGVEEVFLHLFTDGRDSPPKLGLRLIREIEEKINKIGLGKIASLSGRFWSMARDEHWDRTELAYNCLVNGEGRFFKYPKEVFEESYAHGITDEFIKPSLIEIDGKAETIRSGDSAILFNFRKDRPRQLVKAFTQESFHYFTRSPKLKDLCFTAMTEYEKGLDTKVLFPHEDLTNTLSEVISKQKFYQLHIGETEKYAHVTYFFNGGRETPFALEDRIHIPSPRVKTYDLKPEMAAKEITRELLTKLDENRYQISVVNFANADMVGHTGSISATTEGIETIDKCLRLIVEKVLSLEGIVMITADHGNAERKLDEKGEILTEHSRNRVPLILVDRDFFNKQNVLQEGILADIAPTLLALLKIKKPEEMTGQNLLVP